MGGAKAIASFNVLDRFRVSTTYCQASPPAIRDFDPAEVECRERLSGLLKSYHRRAA